MNIPTHIEEKILSELLVDVLTSEYVHIYEGDIIEGDIYYHVYADAEVHFLSEEDDDLRCRLVMPEAFVSKRDFDTDNVIEEGHIYLYDNHREIYGWGYDL